MGAGSASNAKQPEPMEPGSAVSAILVQGDMNIAATCTVTYMDAQHLLACGHPLMQFGMVDLPMTKATVLATLPSPLNAFKIVNATETVGAFVQDRHNGILGEFGKKPEMIPDRPSNLHGREDSPRNSSARGWQSHIHNLHAGRRHHHSHRNLLRRLKYFGQLGISKTNRRFGGESDRG